MSMHEQFADDLPLYALDALKGEERAAVERHLEGCLDCRQEVDRLRGDLALLALSVGGPKPPSRSRDRFLKAIASESRRAPNVTRASWWRAFEWAAGAACLLMILLLVRQNSRLEQRIAGLQSDSAIRQQQLIEAQDLMASLTSSEAEHFTLVASKAPPQPQGKAIYVRGSGTLVFLANNIPQAPQGKIYELWLIPTSGAPIPAGLFKPRSDGTATVLRPPLPAGLEAKAFAITIEPEAGSPAPTSKPIMVGAQG